MTHAIVQSPDSGILLMIAGALLETDWTGPVHLCKDLGPFREILDATQYALVFQDIGNDTPEAMALAEKTLLRRPELVWTMMAENECHALEALQMGVDEFLVKPVSKPQFRLIRLKHRIMSPAAS